MVTAAAVSQSSHPRFESMADGGGGGEGAVWSANWQPIYDRVEAMVTKSQAREEAHAADRARLEAADRAQRGSWEVARRLQRIVEELQAAAREKDAEMDRLRAEAADARKKLQADASKRGRWEAAYLDLLLAANQKLAELRDGDMQDSRTRAETPNSKEIESCAKLNQNTVDHIASDVSAELRKLKKAYEALSSKKDKEVSALLSENDSLRSQLDIMQQDNAKLLKNKEVEAAQATEAALKLQKSVDVFKALAHKKDDGIAGAVTDTLLPSACDLELRDADMEDSRTCADTPNSKETESCTTLNQDTVGHIASDLSAELRKLKQAYETLSSKKGKEVSALRSEKDSVCNQLSIMQQDYAELLKNKKVEAEQAIEAALKLQKNVDALKVLAQKKDDEIARLQTDAMEAKTNLQKMHSLVKEKDVLAQKKDDEIARLQADAMEAKTNLQKMHSLVKEKDDEIQRLKGLHPESIQKRNKDISKTHKKFRSDDPSVRSKSKNNGLMQMVESCVSQTEPIGKDWQDEPRQKRRRVSFISNDDERNGSDDDDDDGQSGSDKDDDKQSGSDEVGDEQSGSDKDGKEQSRSDEDDDEQSGSDEDGDEQSRRAEDGDGQSRCDAHDEDEQSGRNEETTNNPVQKPLGIPKRKRDACDGRLASGKATVKAMVRTQWYWSYMAPAPLCSHKRMVKIRDGRRFVVSTGNWRQYVKDVKDMMADQPDKHKEFIRFLCNFENWRIEDVARTMAGLLDGHPELIWRFNQFLPKYWQIEIEEHHPDESAAAGLIMLKEAE